MTSSPSMPRRNPSPPSTAERCESVAPSRFRARAFAFDLDGTLLGPDHFLRRDVEDILRDLSKKAPVVFATGRMAPSAARFHRLCGLDTPLISYNGAKVGIPGQAPWFEAALGARAVDAVLSFAARRELHVNLYVDDHLFVPRGGPQADDYARHYGVPYEIVDDLCARALRPTKMLLITGSADQAEAVRTLSADCPSTEAHITPSGPTFLDIMPPGCTKASALALVADRLGIPSEGWVAAGDGGNDREMVAWAGFGVAVEGGDPAVAQGAALCVPPLWEDGLSMLLNAVDVE